MNTFNRFKAPLAVAVALAIPVFTACSSNPLDDICCTDFKVGADLTNVDFGVDASISGQFQVLAQAGSDFSGTATAMLDDVTNACKGIATDLGVADADATAADALTDQAAKVKQWCSLAVAQIKAQGVASGSLTIQPPQINCSASVSAKANCQAKCSGSASCDLKANPPVCTGGTLEVDCSGSCTATATAPSFDCTGSCTAVASGSCTAQGGVMCTGKCQGTCQGSTDSSGNCQGMCQGTCSAVAPGASCSGTLSGKCQGMCTASPGAAKVSCSGMCSATATPISCSGGKLEGGCMADAKCDANCDASVQAKASCDVQPFEITASGSASANIDAVIATLQINLPKLLIAVKGRAEAIASIATSFSGAGTADVISDPSKLGVKGTACAVAIVAALANGATNATASINAGLTVTGAVGL